MFTSRDYIRDYIRDIGLHQGLHQGLHNSAIALAYDDPVRGAGAYVETDDYIIVYLLLRYELTVYSHAINNSSLAGQTLAQEIGLLL